MILPVVNTQSLRETRLAPVWRPQEDPHFLAGSAGPPVVLGDRSPQTM